MKAKAKKGMIAGAAALIIAAAAWMIFKKRGSASSASINNKEGRYSDTFRSKNQPPKQSADISAS